MRKHPERGGACVQCGECCKKVRITSVTSHIISNHGSLEEAKSYYALRGIRIVEVVQAADRVLLEIDIPCSQLMPDKSCGLHGTPDKKPLICHKYPWFKDDVESCGYTFE